jgi:transmembrane sensor
MPRRESSSEIDVAAAGWSAKLDGRALSETEERQFDEWLAGDIRRKGAFARAQAIMVYSNRARGLSESYGAPVTRGPNLLRRREVWIGGGVVAAGLAAGGVNVLVGSEIRQRGPVLRTARGEILRKPLVDGSSVTLNTSSVIQVDYTLDEREVDLLQGEALFDVTKDPGRPFVVRAGATRVRAIGTSFSVRRHPDGRVKVLVSEGVVELSANERTQPVRVTSSVAATTEAPSAKDSHSVVEFADLAPADVAKGLAWRDGMLSFDGETLAEAASEFARYASRKIVIDDPGLAREQVTGLFSATDPDGFAKAISASFGSKVDYRPDAVHIYR